MKKCDERQERILEYMKETILDRGFPPTVREICTALNIKSTSTVFKDLNTLEQKGLIKKDPSKPRALVVVDMEKPQTTPINEQLAIDDANTTLIPIIGRVAAGEPILAEQNVDEYIPFPSRFLGKGNNFILSVHGNSMINCGINDGDYIIVREEHEARNGDIVVAMIEGDFEAEATVKRFYREDGHIRLQPENDEMDPIIVPDCTIIGKVQGVYRYLD
jgi:repressor LexA